MDRLQWGVRGAEPPEGRKFFTKFVKIGKEKLIGKEITFQKMHGFFERICSKIQEELKILSNQWVRGRSPRRQRIFSDISINFPLAILVFFLKFAGRPPRQKITIQHLQHIGGSGGEAPERWRKFEIFTEKSDDFYDILKEFNANDNSSFIRKFS